MATVFVETDQYKTYPDTYSSQLEAEEALANLVLTKLGLITQDLHLVVLQLGYLGITGEKEDTGVRETKDLLMYAQRVVKLLGNFKIKRLYNSHAICRRAV